MHAINKAVRSFLRSPGFTLLAIAHSDQSNGSTHVINVPATRSLLPPMRDP